MSLAQCPWSAKRGSAFCEVIGHARAYPDEVVIRSAATRDFIGPDAGETEFNDQSCPGLQEHLGDWLRGLMVGNLIGCLFCGGRLFTAKAVIS